MRKKNKMFLIILIIMFLGLGFALLQTTLSVSSPSARIIGNRWNVQWDNLMVMKGSVTGEQVITSPSISNNTVSFEVLLDKPGDYYEFTINAVNAGTLDAMVDYVEKKVNDSNTIPNYLIYDVTYHDDLPIEESHLLKAGVSEVYKIRIEYSAENIEEVGENGVRLPVSFEVVYVQADRHAQVIPNRVYEISNVEFQIGETIPDAPSGTTLNLYNNYSGAIEEWHHPVFLKHVMENGYISKSYIGFVNHDKLYYLPYLPDYDNANLEKNKAFLDQAFGVSNRHDYNVGEPGEYYLYIDCDTMTGAILRPMSQTSGGGTTYYPYVSIGVATGDGEAVGCKIGPDGDDNDELVYRDYCKSVSNLNMIDLSVCNS